MIYFVLFFVFCLCLKWMVIWILLIVVFNQSLMVAPRVRRLLQCSKHTRGSCQETPGTMRSPPTMWRAGAESVQIMRTRSGMSTWVKSPKTNFRSTSGMMMVMASWFWAAETRDTQSRSPCSLPQQDTFIKVSKSYSFLPNPKAKTDVDNQERHTQIYHLPADAILNQFKITGITTSPGWGLGDLNIKIDVVTYSPS